MDALKYINPESRLFCKVRNAVAVTYSPSTRVLSSPMMMKHAEVGAVISRLHAVLN